MARVLVLTDRDWQDPDWKGATVWQTILALAEAQHQVMVATSLSADRIPFTHPRLTVTQPIRSFRAEQILPLTKLILSFQPDVLQTFAPSPSALWPSLSLWPYLLGVCKVMPQIHRVSSLFDEQDCSPGHPALTWSQQANSVTVFSESQRAHMEAHLKRTVQVVPMESLSPHSVTSEPDPVVLVPAPVSEWKNPETGLHRLAAYCERNPQKQIHILGGWGQWTASQRKSGWRTLTSCADRVHMRAEVSLQEFTACMDQSTDLWLEALHEDSWRYLLATHLGQLSGKKMSLANSWTPTLNLGSTANSLSRIYAVVSGT